MLYMLEAVRLRKLSTMGKGFFLYNLKFCIRYFEMNFLFLSYIFILLFVLCLCVVVVCCCCVSFVVLTVISLLFLFIAVCILCVVCVENQCTRLSLIFFFLLRHI